MTDETPRRYSPTLVLGATCIALVLILATVSIVAVTRSTDAAQAAKDARAAAAAARAEVHRQDVLLAKINTVVASLHDADAARACAAKGQAQAFATILDLLGDFAGTAPYPDTERQKVVDGFHATADTFRSPAKTAMC